MGVLAGVGGGEGGGGGVEGGVVKSATSGTRFSSEWGLQQHRCCDWGRGGTTRCRKITATTPCRLRRRVWRTISSSRGSKGGRRRGRGGGGEGGGGDGGRKLDVGKGKGKRGRGSAEGVGEGVREAGSGVDCGDIGGPWGGGGGERGVESVGVRVLALCCTILTNFHLDDYMIFILHGRPTLNP